MTTATTKTATAAPRPACSRAWGRPEIALPCAVEAGENLDQTPTLVADSGVVNMNTGVGQLMADGVVRRVLARVEVSFTEAFE